MTTEFSSIGSIIWPIWVTTGGAVSFWKTVSGTHVLPTGALIVSSYSSIPLNGYGNSETYEKQYKIHHYTNNNFNT